MAGLDDGIHGQEDGPGAVQKKARTMATSIECIYMVIEELPRQQRLVIQYGLKGMTAKEISLKLNISAGK
jgi:DNA-directed RNA polymerase specialized sigma24 family protein